MKAEHQSAATHGLGWLLEAARPLERIRAAFVHPCNEVSLTSAFEALEHGLVEPVLIGPKSKIEAVAEQFGHDLADIEIHDVEHSHAAAALAVQLAASQDVEALVKGSMHTDELMGAVVSSAGGLRTKRRISHCFVMQTPAYPRPFIITDAAINIAPAVEAKVHIVQNAIDLARVLGVEVPKVALLAAVETVHVSMQATLDAAILCKMADRGQITGGVLDGPLAFDNAVSFNAAAIKGIHSPVAGQADILVAPDLESGNMLAKQLEYMGDAASSGIVLGARVPIMLTSRADPADARLASCAIGVILAHHYRKHRP